MGTKLIGVALLLLLSVPAHARAQTVSTDLSPEARSSYDAARRALVEGDAEAAARSLDRTVELAPDFPHVYHLYLFAYAKRPEARRAAAERFRALAEARPGRAIYWYAYGRLVGDAVARDAAFAKVVALEPGAPWGYWGQGYSLRLAGEVEKAVPLYEKAHALAPGDVVVGSGLVGAY